MPELVLPTVRLHEAFLDSHLEWGPGLHEDGFGLAAHDDVVPVEGFVTWVTDRVQLAHPAGVPCPAVPHGSPRWIVEDGRVLGAIALRHHDDDVAGRIGFGIRPSARRRDLADWALGLMLVEARAILGLDHVLAVCRADNQASARTLKGRGGVLEDVRATASATVRRYRVPLPE